MIDGNNVYYHHMGKYPEDDGLVFLCVDEKNKQCVYAKKGANLTDYLDYGMRMKLARCFAWGVNILLVCGIIICFTLDIKMWIWCFVFLAGVELCFLVYLSLARYTKKLKGDAENNLVKLYYEI